MQGASDSLRKRFVRLAIQKIQSLAQGVLNVGLVYIIVQNAARKHLQ